MNAPESAGPLRIAIVGYGRMGRAVEQAATARGHSVSARVTSTAARGDDGVEIERGRADVAIEFTRPEAAAGLVLTLLARGIPVVSGTTGWNERVDEARAVSRQSGVPFLWAPNFSLGVQVLYGLVARAARQFGDLGGYAPFVHEAHHAAKRDAPSGTARKLAETVIAEGSGKTRLGPAPAEGAIASDQLSVSWVRAGHVPGTHTVAWDGPHETLEIKHTVRSRDVFAEGAVRAAEWLVTRRGDCTLEDMLSGT